MILTFPCVAPTLPTAPHGSPEQHQRMNQFAAHKMTLFCISAALFWTLSPNYSTSIWFKPWSQKGKTTYNAFHMTLKVSHKAPPGSDHALASETWLRLSLHRVVLFFVSVVQVFLSLIPATRMTFVIIMITLGCEGCRHRNTLYCMLMKMCHERQSNSHQGKAHAWKKERDISCSFLIENAPCFVWRKRKMTQNECF